MPERKQVITKRSGYGRCLQLNGHRDATAGHSDSPKSFGLAFGVGTALNVGFVAIEAIYGVLANSMALLADAGHNLGDVIGLLIAWSAIMLAKRRPTARYTYGFRSSSILAALINAVVLLVITGGIAWEAVRRLFAPQPVLELEVIIVAAIGIIVNGATACLFAAGRKGDLNIKAEFVHMAADAATSVGVVASGLAILATGWNWLDPAVSLGIAAVVIWSTWGLLRDSIELSLNAVPRAINPGDVRKYLEGCDGVASVHDLHIWPMSTTETALTCHLVMPQGHPGDAFTGRVARELSRSFQIVHTTLQIEIDEVVARAFEHDSLV
jgi:cobalt-zinc-cadmium efflux system protein